MSFLFLNVFPGKKNIQYIPQSTQLLYFYSALTIRFLMYYYMTVSCANTLRICEDWPSEMLRGRLGRRATRHCGLKKREESGIVSGDEQEGQDKVKGRGRSFREMGQLSL